MLQEQEINKLGLEMPLDIKIIKKVNKDHLTSVL